MRVPRPAGQGRRERGSDVDGADVCGLHREFVRLTGCNARDLTIPIDYYEQTRRKDADGGGGRRKGGFCLAAGIQKRAG